jgi:hypothetical protein
MMNGLPALAGLALQVLLLLSDRGPALGGAGGPIYCTPGLNPPQECPVHLPASQLCPGISPVFECPKCAHPVPGLGCVCPNVTTCNPTPFTCKGRNGHMSVDVCPPLTPGGDFKACPKASNGGNCSLCPFPKTSTDADTSERP